MNESELARKIVARLTERLEELPQPILQSLRAARESALAKPPASQPPRGRYRTGLPGFALRLALPAVVVVATLAGLIFWQLSAQMEDDPDAGMLAGELPLHAFTDPGFETWLQNASHSPRQPAR